MPMIPRQPQFSNTQIGRHVAVALSLALVVGSMTMAGSAFAQSQTPSSSPGERVNDPGFSDTDPSRAGLRVDLRTDLRINNDFSTLYRVNGAPHLYQRTSGALSAVFPRSEYQRGEAVVPSGTMWVVGSVDAWLAQLEAAGVVTPFTPGSLGPAAGGPDASGPSITPNPEDSSPRIRRSPLRGTGAGDTPRPVARAGANRQQSVPYGTQLSNEPASASRRAAASRANGTAARTGAPTDPTTQRSTEDPTSPGALIPPGNNADRRILARPETRLARNSEAPPSIRRSTNEALPAIFDDADYRSERIRGLLEAAARRRTPAG